ncbi:peptidase M61 [Tamlana agarivorans]|uniref:Peptidase M61 n=1 Tax=Pseudotamlana agarivorans TaxID=481183 RepID=A0ACC5UAX3_9FLAO|nr:peptidase M61 [Tamlana agarivorans]MBU2951464.1 peptidase M61 [Tamlana agarivorans]
MKNRFLALTLTGLILASCGTKKTSANDLAVNTPIETWLDLVHINEDRVPVTINPGRFTVDEVTYRLPKVVQGTYAVSDFGKYVDDIKAYDYNGKEMAVKNVDDNTWTISNAKELDKISYLVNDTFDIEEEGGIGHETPFSPSGTNIEENNFVLNLHGFIGYFDSLKTNQYKVDITSPSKFVRSAALQEVGSKTSEDGKTTTSSYIAQKYFDITDNPLMYGDLDVETFQVGDIKIVLSVYSPSKSHSAKSLKETVYKMMEAQKAYLGDINATSRYDIFLYLSEGKEDSPKGFGALEHHTSTVVVFPDSMPAAALSKNMIDVVSHEFFHIVTPLSVHSEDVQYFDYNNPTFSKHLWMYEGVTEYFATLFQINQGLVDEAEFYNTIMGKINYSKQMDDTMSFTIMSENVIKEPYKDQYLNVYQKGALIGMCIDILMREESDGHRGILSLMKELSNKYGKDKPFEDDKLFDEIVAMTYPSLGEFFEMHVIGDIPINYNEFFDKVGLEVKTGQVEGNHIIMGGAPIVTGDPEKRVIFFTEQVAGNSFWVEQGVLPNDILKSVDGKPMTFENANTILQEIYTWEEGQDVNIIVVRDGVEKVIKTKVTKTYISGEGLNEKADATAAQKSLREAWLRG